MGTSGEEEYGLGEEYTGLQWYRLCSGWSQVHFLPPFVVRQTLYVCYLGRAIFQVVYPRWVPVSALVTEQPCHEFSFGLFSSNLSTSLQGIDEGPEGLKLISDIIREKMGIDVSVLMGANIASEVASEKFCETTIGEVTWVGRPGEPGYGVSKCTFAISGIFCTGLFLMWIFSGTGI